MLIAVVFILNSMIIMFVEGFFVGFMVCIMAIVLLNESKF